MPSLELMKKVRGGGVIFLQLFLVRSFEVGEILAL